MRRQPIRYSASFPLNHHAIIQVCRELTAQKYLTARPTQYLVVRRDCLRLHHRVHTALNARRPLDLTLNKGLNDSAHLLNVFQNVAKSRSQLSNLRSCSARNTRSMRSP